MGDEKENILPVFWWEKPNLDSRTGETGFYRFEDQRSNWAVENQQVSEVLKIDFTSWVGKKIRQTKDQLLNWAVIYIEIFLSII